MTFHASRSAIRSLLDSYATLSVESRELNFQSLHGDYVDAITEISKYGAHTVSGLVGKWLRANWARTESKEKLYSSEFAYEALFPYLDRQSGNLTDIAEEHAFVGSFNRWVHEMSVDESLYEPASDSPRYEGERTYADNVNVLQSRWVHDFFTAAYASLSHNSSRWYHPPAECPCNHTWPIVWMEGVESLCAKLNTANFAAVAHIVTGAMVPFLLPCTFEKDDDGQWAVEVGEAAMHVVSGDVRSAIQTLIDAAIATVPDADVNRFNDVSVWESVYAACVSSNAAFTQEVDSSAEVDSSTQELKLSAAPEAVEAPDLAPSFTLRVELKPEWVGRTIRIEIVPPSA